MQKIHLSLVGAQPLPVYNGIIDSEAEKVILLCSEETKKVALNLSSLSKFTTEIYLLEHPFIYKYVKDFITQIVKKNPKAEWSFNITGGTKIMTLVAADYARENKIPYIYIDQNNILTDFFAEEQSIFFEKTDLDAYFKLFGQIAKTSVKLETIDKEFFDIKDLFMNNNHELKYLFSDFRKKKYTIKDTFTLSNNNYELSWNAEDQIAMFYEDKTGLETHLQGAKVFDVIFNTAWFELEVIQILSKWKRNEELYWNTIFERKHNRSDKNEIDIIVDTSVKLFFFECKTNVYDIKDVDKFRNIVKIFGGLAAKPILVTMVKPNADVIEKCNDLNIKSFWFKEKNKKINTSNDFLKFLDVEYEKINPI